MPIKTATDSIQLVYQDENANLILNEKALDKIRNLTGDIATCVIVGQYRSGKSFLLNHLYKKLTKSNDDNEKCETFGVDHGQDSFTKGCWMNGNISQIKVNNKETNLLLIDTEGIESSNDNEAWDTKLFTFSMLMASVFIYNTNQSLSSETFKKLSIMSNICNKIKLCSDDDVDSDDGELKAEGPVYLSIVRNFTLKPVYTAKEDIERFLQPERDSAHTNKLMVLKRNKIRDGMKSSFKRLECARLPPPAFSVKQLQDLENVKFSDLTEDFQLAFNDMCAFVSELIEPKSINGEAFNGFRLAEYLSLIVNSINSNDAIFLYDCLASVARMEELFYEEEFAKVLKVFRQKSSLAKSEHERRSLVNEHVGLLKQNISDGNKLVGFKTKLAMEFFNSELNLLSKKFPLNPDLFELEFNKNIKFCLSLLSDLNKENSETFTNETTELVDELVAYNLSKISKYNRNQVIEYWDQTMSSKYPRHFKDGHEYEKLETFENDFSQFKVNFCRVKQFDTSNVLPSSFWTTFEKENSIQDVKASMARYAEKVVHREELERLEQIVKERENRLEMERINAARLARAIQDQEALIAREIEKSLDVKRAAEARLAKAIDDHKTQLLKEREDRLEAERANAARLAEAVKDNEIQREKERLEAERVAEAKLAKAIKELETEKAKERLEAERLAEALYTPLSPPSTPVYSHTEKSKSSQSGVGTYISRGCANGNEVFEGPRGGLFYYNSGGNKQYVNAATVKYY